MVGKLGAMVGGLRASLPGASDTSAVHAVLGNEACDLDSAVSALAMAFHLAQTGVPGPIPVLNVPRKDFATKTEVVHALRRFLPDEVGRTAEEQAGKLVFVDDLDLAALAKARRLHLTLVDHHLLAPSQAALRSSVVRVVDHHARHEPSLKDVAEVDVRPVASCASLVADRIRAASAASLDDEPGLMQLLRATVALDAGGKPAEGSVDEAVLLWLESRLKGQVMATRKELRAELDEAREDTASLSPVQVLRKDLKTVLADGGLLVGIPRVRVLLEGFAALVGGDAKVLGVVEAFAKEGNMAGVVVLFSGDGRRQILVYSADGALRAKLRAALPAALELTELSPQGPWAPAAVALEQGDASLTRKAVLPALTKALLSDPKLPA